MATLSRRSRRTLDIWPGFVDALATLLMVIIFLLMIFVLAQFFLSETLSGRDAALRRLQTQVDELADLLALEKRDKAQLTSDLARLTSELQASLTRSRDLGQTIATLREQLDTATARADDLAQAAENADATVAADKATIELQARQLAKLANDIQALTALKAELEQEVKDLLARTEDAEKSVSAERELSESARAQIALLNQQMVELRNQLAVLNDALEAANREAEAKDIQIQLLNQRLNTALASKVLELQRFRSEFFGELRKILGNQPGIRIVGDRFVFSSEVLFATGSAAIGPEGREQVQRVAQALKDIAARIPESIDWILLVEGHTDRVPINTPEFPSNWELSAARAFAVVRLLIDSGISPKRLAGAGYGEFQPIDPANTAEAFQRNRRIELKLTQR